MSSAASLTTANRRPIPLQVRDDLIFERIEYLGISYWVVKDPVGLKYFRLQPEQYHALQLLNGDRHLEELRDALHDELPTVRLQLSDIQHLITDLHQKGLVFSNRIGQGASLAKLNFEEKKKKLFNTMRSLLYVRLPGWDPEAVLARLYPLVRWIYHPTTVTLTLLFVISSWVLLAVQFDTFTAQMPEFQQFFSWPNLLYLWITLGTCKVIHEFGHGLSCKHFGGECHAMGVMLLVFSPCLYCDVSDSWMLKSKWQRIAIGAAGMYIEVVISAIAIYIWWNTQSGLIHHLCLNIFFVTTITTVIWNANPLMRFDGYYMMSDFLEIPNLRPKADRLLDWFGWYCLGIEAKPDPFMPESGRAGFVMFAIAAGLYRWFILAAIMVFLYTVLKPYGLQSIGIALAVVSIVTILFNLVLNIYKQVTAPRIEPLSRPKIAISLGLLVTVIACTMAVPLPLHIEAMFLVEPHDVRHVYTPVPGRLENRPVQPGDQVTLGDTLATLTNPALALEQLRLEQQEKVQLIRVSVANALEDRSREELARANRESARTQLSEFQKQIERMTITAPCTGTVVAPPRVPAPPLDSRRDQLGSWHGTPLEDRNRNCLLPDRTHLLSIAPDSEFQAVVVIDQGDRNDMVSAEESLGFSGISSPAGLTITSVLPDTPAARAGIVPGDQITSNNGSDVTRLADLLPRTTDSTNKTAPRPLLLSVKSTGGENREVKLAPARSPTRVELKFDHLPARTYEGFIEKISRRDLEFVPELLSNKLGGEVATATDRQGRERPLSPAYQATVLLRKDPALLKTGLRGRSRFLVDTRTPYQWIYRWYRRTFRFRL